MYHLIISIHWIDVRVKRLKVAQKEASGSSNEKENLVHKRSFKIQNVREGAAVEGAWKRVISGKIKFIPNAIKAKNGERNHVNLVLIVD